MTLSSLNYGIQDLFPMRGTKLLLTDLLNKIRKFKLFTIVKIFSNAILNVKFQNDI